jgi:hypothetical protein
VRRNSDPSLTLSNIVAIRRSPRNGQFLWEATHQITCYTSEPGRFGELRKIRVEVSPSRCDPSKICERLRIAMSVKRNLAADDWTGSIDFTIESREADRVVAKMEVADGVRNAFGTVRRRVDLAR